MSTKRLHSIFITFITCYIFWLLLTMSLEVKELVYGVIVCLITAWFSSGFFVQNSKTGKRMLNPAKFAILIFYIFVIYMQEVVKANIAMAKYVLLNKPFRQAIVRIPVRGITDGYGLMLLSNCITMTPGTITFDVAEPPDGADYPCVLYVQWLNLESEDEEEAAEIIKGRMERWLRRVFI